MMKTALICFAAYWFGVAGGMYLERRMHPPIGSRDWNEFKAEIDGFCGTSKCRIQGFGYAVENPPEPTKME